MFGTGDVRIGAATVVQAIAEGRRAAYAVDAFLRGNDLASIRTRQTLAEPQPSSSIVPFTSEVKEPRYRMKALEAEERNRNYVEYELPYSRGRSSPDRPAASSAPARRSATATCGAWGSSTARRSRRSSRSPTRAPAADRSTRTFTGVNHDYIRDDSHAFILREPSRCIDCGRCAQVCAEVVGAACYDFMRVGFDTLVTTPLDMSFNDTPACPAGAVPRPARPAR